MARRVVPQAVARIVHVLSSFGVGGQERVALDLAIGQQARGHDVAVVSLAGGPDGPLADEFAAAGVATAQVPRRDGLDPLLTAKLARWLRAYRADVVHTHNPLPLIYGAPAARLAGAIAIHTKHGRNPGGRAHRLARRAAAGIPAHLRGRHQRQLAQAFAPWLPIEVLVAPADAERARALVWPA